MRSLVSRLSARTVAVTAGLVLCAVTLAYSNHFQNSFHFDDYHAINDNIYIRSLSNIPRFFTDATTQSVKAQHRTWRPLVATSLAIDYWLGGGLESTFWFHLSTFLWFLLQLLLMYWLYARLLDLVRPGPRNPWIAWFAVAWYGLHPAIAETVNYIIQRADVISTLGVVAALVVFARFPKPRKCGLYLVPFVLGTLAKPPALVFPFLLLAYVFLFEESVSPRGFLAAARKSAPATALAFLLAALQRAMTPKSFMQTIGSAYEYLITQPYVAWRYFGSFFLPTHLSADSDLQAFSSILHPEVLLGFLFLGVLLFAICATARRSDTRPISFGLVWFVLALAPTSLFPLADVENDHRMFFPFVGLVIAVTWAGNLILSRRPLGDRRWAVAAGLVCLLLYALGTRGRNEVWRTEESLWHDVTIKSPRNGRGLMNYGLELMDKGASSAALTYFERAAAFAPNYPTLEISLGLATSALDRDTEAERHFRRAIQLDPKQAESYFHYARWLNSKTRSEEAVKALSTALALDSAFTGARYLLLQVYAEHGLWGSLRSFAEDCLRLTPNDPVVLKYLGAEQQLAAKVATAETLARSQPTPESLLQLSAGYHQMGRYQDCIAAAQEALRLRPDFAEAYNNIAAAYLSMGQWDEAIRAASEALRIKSDFQFARNNLEFAKSQKNLAAGGR
jgi:tetratricopeptide (TPR) repeat protein